MSTTYLPEVRLADIKPHGANPRRDLTDVDDLAASIKEIGVLEPLVVAPGGVQHILIAGHRRLAAAKTAGLATVPAILREDLDTPDKQLAAILTENTQRVDLTPIEEADAFKQLVAFPGYSQAKAAKATGRSAKYVKGRLALAALPEGARKKIHAGEITLDEAATITAFVGTPDYKKIVAAAGTSQFGFVVQRAKDDAKVRAQVEWLKAYAAEHDWTVITRTDWTVGRVLGQWQVKGSIEKAVEALTDGPYVLTVHGDTSWSIGKASDQAEQDDAERGEIFMSDGSRVARSVWEEQQAERRQREADLDTARIVRRDWIAGRIKTLIVKDAERAPLLRLLLVDVLEDTDWNDDGLALAGYPMPAGDDDVVEIEDAVAWAGTLNENQAWKALLVFMLDLSRCGWSSETSHTTSIRLAMTLGYEPSDIERAIIAPAVVDGAE